jgi:hypothetical protein
MKFNRKGYDMIRRSVLMNADGANVHKLHGLLGNVLNNATNYVAFKNMDEFDDAEASKRQLWSALKQLGESHMFGMLFKE